MMIQGEFDAHLDYDKYQKSKQDNTSNGYSKKKARTSSEESQITVPTNPDASFNPIIVPKRGNMFDGMKNVIVSLYTKGMSNANIEELILEVYDFRSKGLCRQMGQQYSYCHQKLEKQLERTYHVL